LLCDRAARSLPEVTGMRVASLAVTYLRAPGSVGDEIELVPVLVRRGRRLAVVEVRVHGPRTRDAVVAVATLLTP
jgi:acyl-coenzyme A thioesterase PaaI-like protein